MNLLCPWESAQYLIFSSNVPTLLYYSHFIAVIAAFIFAIGLFSRRKESLSVRLFLFTIVGFIVWTIIDVLLWASNRADLVMFYWSLQVLLELFIYSGALYFAYTFVTGRDLSFWAKLFVALLMAPIIGLLPTNQILPGIDISYCNAVESGLLFYYVYGYEILLSIIILFFAFKQAKQSSERKKEVWLFTLGTIIFLLAFSSGNIIGSWTEDWALAQIGLFGMPVFIAFLAYMSVRFKSFNLKLFGTQVIVIALWLLTLAILFIRKIENVRMVVIATLILFTILGYQLVKSVRREIEAKERVEKLAADLRIANAGQENLIHVINHQLKSYLAKGRNVFAELMEEPALGFTTLPDMAKDMIKQGFDALTEGNGFIQQILNGSSAEKGTLAYNMQKIDLAPIYADVTAKLKEKADAKGLAFEVVPVSADAGPFMVQADAIQIKEALKNLVDNSIVYTPEGKVTVSLTRSNGKILLSVRDSGIGLTAEDKGHLFTKGGRGADSLKYNTNSTGYGLAFVMGVVKAHGGRVWAESQGRGKGSQFYMELGEVK